MNPDVQVVQVSRAIVKAGDKSDPLWVAAVRRCDENGITQAEYDALLSRVSPSAASPPVADVPAAKAVVVEVVPVAADTELVE